MLSGRWAHSHFGPRDRKICKMKCLLRRAFLTGPFCVYSFQLAAVNLMAEDAAESGSRKDPHKIKKPVSVKC
jgi:hypothetical protein